MKKIISIFIIVLISVGVADLIQGVILTLLYNPNSYSTTNGLELASYLQYTISALTVTFALWGVYKVKSFITRTKPSIKI
ncbi:hypothetical protein MKZ20_04070 [Psychrobacillus sp. FSL K6-2684]|uniref:hypothetical protein n=1 Tax=unclassified Psychrobacillus TaxID=2636677 RepID=UPI001247B3FF|nr:hypothetical protein [Psychrobacillus sp. AK 1817]QEY20698.1 hypothetical protein D0S48_08290 [Psychrobacillus sp. AK 1817]